MTCVNNGFKGKFGKWKAQRLPCSDFTLRPSGFCGSREMLLLVTKTGRGEGGLQNLHGTCLVSVTSFGNWGQAGGKHKEGVVSQVGR